MKANMGIIVNTAVVSLLLAAGQIFLKMALSMAASGIGVVDLVKVISVEWRAWAAVACTGIGALLWLKVLSRAEVSHVYPMISLSYAFGLLGAWLFLGEVVTVVRIVGVVLICTGVAILNIN